MWKKWCCQTVAPAISSPQGGLPTVDSRMPRAPELCSQGAPHTPYPSAPPSWGSDWHNWPLSEWSGTWDSGLGHQQWLTKHHQFPSPPLLRTQGQSPTLHWPGVKFILKPVVNCQNNKFCPNDHRAQVHFPTVVLPDHSLLPKSHSLEQKLFLFPCEKNGDHGPNAAWPTPPNSVTFSLLLSTCTEYNKACGLGALCAKRTCSYFKRQTWASMQPTQVWPHVPGCDLWQYEQSRAIRLQQGPRQPSCRIRQLWYKSTADIYYVLYTNSFFRSLIYFYPHNKVLR